MLRPRRAAAAVRGGSGAAPAVAAGSGGGATWRAPRPRAGRKGAARRGGGRGRRAGAVPGVEGYGGAGGEDRADLPPAGAKVVVEGGAGDGGGLAVATAAKAPSDLEYLQELIAIQADGPKDIGFFGTRNMGFLHQQLIEILSYAMVLTENHVYTSGATGTNAAVIRGAVRAERPDLLTVVLPQSITKQPPESQELLKQVTNIIEMPDNDDMSLLEASTLCNADIVSRVQQVICFAFHDSKLLLETCREAKQLRKIVTLFYLD